MIEDKTVAYQHWADDYLVKPFALKELVLRINALCKRSESSDIWSYEGVEMYTDENRLYIDWTEIQLTPQERRIVHCLIGSERTVERAELIETVWWSDAIYGDNDGTLDVAIAKLRKKIWKVMIETIKGVGYRMVRVQ